MIKLCKHLMDDGNCNLKKIDDYAYETCPAITCDCFHNIRNINLVLMNGLACSDKWSE